MTIIRAILAYFALLSGLFPSASRAETPIPTLSGPVVDTAGLFSRNEIDMLSGGIRAYFQRYGIQFQILTVNGLDGEPIEAFSIRVAERWKIGAKGTGNGVLAIAALQDRAFRIEVGDGLEGELPDALCGQIIDQFVVPAFRRARYADGFASAISNMAKALGHDMHWMRDRSPGKTGAGGRIPGFLQLLVLLVVFYLAFASRGGRGGGLLAGMLLGNMLGRGGGGFSGGGGGWGGGGGGYSGGGSSGRW